MATCFASKTAVACQGPNWGYETMQADQFRYLQEAVGLPMVARTATCEGGHDKDVTSKDNAAFLILVFAQFALASALVLWACQAAMAQSNARSLSDVGIVAPAWLNQPIAQPLPGRSSNVAAHIGPSFSCRGRLSPTERRICDNGEIASQDFQMADTYRQLIEEGDEGLKADQKQWIARRNRCGISDLCLSDIYRDRVSELKSRLALRAGGGMFITSEFRCDNGTSVFVRFDNSGAETVAFFNAGDGFERQLESAISGSGSRYTDGVVDLHTKRGVAVVSQGGASRVCHQN